jgi:hypothetical protein
MISKRDKPEVQEAPKEEVSRSRPTYSLGDEFDDSMEELTDREA